MKPISLTKEDIEFLLNAIDFLNEHLEQMIEEDPDNETDYQNNIAMLDAINLKLKDGYDSNS